MTTLYKYSTTPSQVLASMSFVSTLTGGIDPVTLTTPQAARTTYGLGGAQFGDGSQNGVWFFPVLRYSYFEALCSALGISQTTRTALISVYTLSVYGNPHTFAKYNCRVVYPTIGDGRIRDISKNGAYLDVRFELLGMVTYA